MLKRYQAALNRRRLWDGVLGDAYAMALPQYESPASGIDGGAHRGEKRGKTVYDSTAADSLDRRAARTAGQLFPPFRPFADVQPADGLNLTEDEEKKLRAHHALAMKKFHAAIDVSNFHTEMPQALRDAYISTGALNIDFGTEENPLAFEALPISQLAPEESADGVIRTSFRRREIAVRDLPLLWPTGTFPEEISRAARAGKDDKHGVIEANVWDPENRQTLYRAYLASDEKLIASETLPEPRTVVFRVDKVPGETMGRGPVIRALPDIQTANKVVELVLKNASIAVTGIWQAEDDGTLNPATVRLTPGAIIPIAPGSAGLRPLDAPGRFDVSQLVLDQLRERIRTAIEGPALPPSDERVRTAFELSERRADQLSVELPMTLRLLGELFHRLMARCLFILSHPKMAGSRFYIPPSVVAGDRIKMVPTSPLARIAEREEALVHAATFNELSQTAPEQVARVIDMDAYVRDRLRRAGFPEDLVRSPDEVAERTAAEAAARQAAEGLDRLTDGDLSSETEEGNA